jgi:hypothetical protein
VPRQLRLARAKAIAGAVANHGGPVIVNPEEVDRAADLDHVAVLNQLRRRVHLRWELPGITARQNRFQEQPVGLGVDDRGGLN